MKKNLLFSVIAVSIVLIFPVICRAHYPWLNLRQYTLEKSGTINLTIGWGHIFPGDGLMDSDRVDELYIIFSDGSRIDVEAKSEQEFASVLPVEKGAGMVAGQTKGGYWTRTTRGGHSRSKIGLESVIGCSFSVNTMKALFDVGSAGGKVDMVVGHPLEIIPLVNPATLEINDYMPIRILLNGKAFKGTFNATYAGFSMEENAFAYTAETNAEGHGRLPILSSGIWMIKVEHQEPYPDTEVCDTRTYRALLTFQVD